MDEYQNVVCVGRPRWQTKWWMRCKEIKRTIYPDGSQGGLATFYVPWWAWPFELIHRMIFGNPKLKRIE